MPKHRIKSIQTYSAAQYSVVDKAAGKNPKDLSRSGSVRPASLCLEPASFNINITLIVADAGATVAHFLTTRLLLCRRESLFRLDLRTSSRRITEGWFRPLHHCPSVRNTNDSVVSK